MYRNLETRTVLLLLIFIVLSYTSITQIDGRISTVTKFDGYLKLLKSTQNYKERLRIAQAVWGQIRAENANDLDTIAKLYEQLPDFPNNDDDDENEHDEIKLKHKQGADELKQILRRHLVQKNAQLLANALSGPEFYGSKKVAKYCNNLLINYDYALVREAYEKSINEMYNTLPTEKLAAHLLSIYQPEDERTFQLMLELQLHLFGRFTHTRDVNDVYLLNFAYYIYKYQQTDNYRNLDKELQHRTEKAISKLPNSLRNLLFLNKFALRNEFYNEYFYTTNVVQLDDLTRATFTWVLKTIADNQFSWYHNITASSDVLSTNFKAHLDLKFHFISDLIKTYLYFAPVVKTMTDIVGAWSPIGVVPPVNGDWNVYLKEEYLIIKQGDFAMCANNTLYDTNRRFVIGVKTLSDQTNFDKACQWTVHPFNIT